MIPRSLPRAALAPRYLTDGDHLYRVIGSPDALKGQLVEDVGSGYEAHLSIEQAAACSPVIPNAKPERRYGERRLGQERRR